MKNCYVLLLSLLLLPSIMNGQTCKLSNFSTESTGCNADNGFSVVIDFDYEEVSDSFVLRGNGKNYGTYAYANLPITVPGLAGDCETEYEFVVIDKVNDDCQLAWEYGIECCDEACTLEINEVEVGDCEEGLISLTFNLEHRNTGQTSFDVFSRNDFVGAYKYADLPITITDFPTSGGATERLVICNNDDESCCDTYVFETTCSCIIKNVTADIIDCNEEEGTWFAFIDFDYNMTSDSFFLGGNNNRYGNFAYSELPITVGPLPFDDELEYEFLAVDRLSAFCFDFVDVGVVNSCASCTIYDVHAEAGLCDGGGFIVDIEFKTEGTVSDSFIIRGNGKEYGKYAYGETFYRIGPIEGDCETIYEFVIIDEENQDCRNFTSLEEVVCCEAPDCNIANPRIAIGECGEDGNFFVEISFEQAASAEGTFSIRGNGKNYGTFSYGEEEYRIGPLAGDCETLYEFVLIDSEDEACQEVIEFSEPKCCESSCELSDIVLAVKDCNDDNLFMVELSFKSSGAISDSFIVRGNGRVYGTYSYGESAYEIGPLEGDCETVYEFVIIDQNNEDCRLVGALEEPICCRENCVISKIEAGLECPGDGNIIIEIVKDGIPANRELQLKINNETVDGLFISDFPYELPTEGLSFPVEIELSEVENQACKLSVIVEENCDERCNISELSVSFTECDDQDRLVLTIDATHNREKFKSFRLDINEKEIGFFTYDQLPLVVKEIVNPDDDFPVTLIDAEEDGCHITTTVEAIVCESSLDEVRELGVDAYTIGSRIMIDNNHEEPVEVIIHDISGRRIFSGTVYTQLYLRQNLNNGLYFLTAKAGRRIATQKLIITH